MTQEQQAPQAGDLPHGIDITAPGGIAALMDFHRQTFGDAQMNANASGGDAGSADGGSDGSGDGDGSQGPGDGSQGQEGGTDGQEEGQENDNASKADDPKTAAARDEAAQNRIKAREAEERATAAEKARDELVRTLGKHLGLVQDDDDGDQAPDADALAKSVAEEQAKAAEAQRELAVYKAAGTIADPERLLDSRRFLSSISEIDPTDGDAIKAAVKAAVDSDPSLASRRERGASSADTAGGPGGGSAPKAEVGLLSALGNHYGTN